MKKTILPALLHLWISIPYGESGIASGFCLPYSPRHQQGRSASRFIRPSRQFVGVLHSRRRTSSSRSNTFNDTATPPASSLSDDATVDHVDFWGTVIRKPSGVGSGSGSGPPPCVPSLDPLDGPLPSGAFLYPASVEHFDTKPTCRLSVGMDLSHPYRDSRTLVRSMQKFIDAGLTTFQLASSSTSDEHWGEAELYGRLVLDTPAHVVKDCHLVVPWLVNFPNTIKNDINNNNNLGDSDNGFVVSKQSVREVVLEKLQRTRGDVIDTLQVRCDYTSSESASYLMDILDYVTDLQREGYVRYIGITSENNNLPGGGNTPKKKKLTKRNDPLASFLQTAHNYGFLVDTVQLQGNVLSPPLLPKSASTTRSPILSLTSPLAGGFLTDQHNGKVRIPSPIDLTPSERRHWQTTLSPWGLRQREKDGIQYGWNRQELWKRYQRDILDDTLSQIALKHEVSIASVALRWALQATPRGSAMVTCNLGVSEDDERKDSRLSLKHRPKRLRDVFRFELDEEDMHLLEYMACVKNERDDDFSFDSIEEMEREFLLYQDEIMEQHERRRKESDEYYPAIDFKNQKLWL
jgi:aryl-alcohol dehydrogenase-like predicted oxidoreductase